MRERSPLRFTGTGPLVPPLLGRSVINLFTFSQTLTLNQAEEQLAKARCLADRWGELSRKLEKMRREEKTLRKKIREEKEKNKEN